MSRIPNSKLSSVLDAEDVKPGLIAELLVRTLRDGYAVSQKASFEMAYFAKSLLGRHVRRSRPRTEIGPRPRIGVRNTLFHPLPQTSTSFGKCGT